MSAELELALGLVGAVVVGVSLLKVLAGLFFVLPRQYRWKWLLGMTVGVVMMALGVL